MSHRELFIWQMLLGLKELSTKGLFSILGVDSKNIDAIAVIARDNKSFNLLRNLYKTRRLAKC